MAAGTLDAAAPVADDLVSHSRGEARWQVDVVDGQSTSVVARAQYPLSLLVPQARGKSSWAFLASHGGGLVTGDSLRIITQVGAGAAAYLGTQSVGKVYRGLDDQWCTQEVHHVVTAGGLLLWLPDPTSCFAGSRYRQSIHYDLAPGASLVACDAYLAGRQARGEFWSFDQIISRTKITCSGRPLAIDHLHLQGGPTARRMAGWGALATVFLLGERAGESVAAGISILPEVTRDAPLLASLAPCAGGHLLRLACRNHAQLTHVLEALLAPLADQLGGQPWMRRP